MRSTLTRSPLAAATLAAIATLSAACASGGTNAPSASAATATAPRAAAAAASSTPASPSASLDPAAQAALSSYTKMWQTVQADANGGSYNILGLSAYVTGKPLQLFSENLADWRAKGVVMKGTAVMHPLVTAESPAAAPTTVHITDHFDDRNALLYYSATGALVDDTPGGCRLIHATVNNMQGVWRVTALDTGADQPCTTP